MSSLDTKKVIQASKWSVITEVLAKLVAPLSAIVLARILTPEAFGVVTTITMITSFVEIFTDGGFQKYIIQHEFADEKDKNESIYVAFWSNMSLAFILWGIIAVFSEPLAALVGNEGLGNVIAIACVSLPLQALSSVQMAQFKRDFDFKTLFKVRMLGLLTPVLVTIPLALWLKSYWALIGGTIFLNLVNAISLTYFSNFKIKFYYSWKKLKEMLSFTIWTMAEAVSIWLTAYVDIFIVGRFLSDYYLGLYKTSMTTVGSIMAIITSATTPILFSALSRLQNNREEFSHIFFKFQKIVGMFVIPIGVGIFVFRYLVTEILLGSQWVLAANFIGLWALTSSAVVVLANYSSEVYRSLGRPKLSVLSQWLHIIVLLPAMAIAVRYSFEATYITRSLVRLEAILVDLIIMNFVVKISPFRMMKNIAYSSSASIIAGALGIILLFYSDSMWWAILCAIFFAISYLGIISLSNSERNILVTFIKKTIHKDK